MGGYYFVVIWLRYPYELIHLVMYYSRFAHFSGGYEELSHTLHVLHVRNKRHGSISGYRAFSVRLSRLLGVFTLGIRREYINIEAAKTEFYPQDMRFALLPDRFIYLCRAVLHLLYSGIAHWLRFPV